MHLFFLLSGAGTFFALRFRSRGQYAKERFKRLFLPFIFGTILIIPPQGYYTLLRNPDFHLNYLQYLPQFFKIDPRTMGRFRGAFGWGHLWFILYLYVFSMLALPLFLYLRSEAGQKVISRLAHFMEKPGMIFLPLVPIGLLEVILRPGWPSTQNLVNDWANFVNYILFFTCGYLLCADSRFGAAIDRHLKYSLPLAGYLMWVYLNMCGFPFAHRPGYTPKYMAFIFLESATTWTWIIFILGMGRKYLNGTNRVLPYANEAAYPFYILHQTVIVIIGFYVLKLGLGVPLGYAVITTASLVATILIYDLCIKRWNPVRFLFGMKPKQ
jgi:surface polysaccharide O-acyltransferase-like enzyme